MCKDAAHRCAEGWWQYGLCDSVLHAAWHHAAMPISHAAPHHAAHKKYILIAEGICYNKHLDDMRRCRKEVFIETDCDKLVCYNNGT